VYTEVREVATTKRFHGIAASDGIAIGEARLLAPRLVVVDRWIAPEAVPGEIERLDVGLETTDEQLLAVSRHLDGQHRHEGRAIVEAHRLILRSDEIIQEAKFLIADERLAADAAVRRVIDRIVTKFEEMDDLYLRERSSDIEAVGERLLRSIAGLPELRWSDGAAAGAIGVGASLSAIDAFHLHRAGLVGLATEKGGKTSHASIIVRALEIPYVAGVGDLVRGVRPRSTLIVDGTRGSLIVDPDEATLMEYQERHRQLQVRARKLLAGGRRPAATSDGVRVEIGANIETLSEIARAIDFGAESVGLLRTEFLYLHRADLPGEEEQYRDAVAALKALGGRPATFRTLDLGGEKLPLAVRVPAGANPSLGVRAIRFSARRPDIFRTQLRALYRASAAGPLRIMFPLISSIAELHDARRVCARVREELDREGLPYDPRVPTGAMIETPSAALTADHLADASDFFSIGTNDLMQYTFAADRENQDVYYLYHPLHPAMLRLMKQAIDASARAGRPLSVCGDMAADPAYTWILLGLGVRQLSMAPRYIPAVRSIIERTRLPEAQAMASGALLCRSDREVEELVIADMQRRFPLELAVVR
jgi:phosphotransferase system enzyme I (PtsI)